MKKKSTWGASPTGTEQGQSTFIGANRLDKQKISENLDLLHFNAQNLINFITDDLRSEKTPVVLAERRFAQCDGIIAAIDKLNAYGLLSSDTIDMNLAMDLSIDLASLKSARAQLVERFPYIEASVQMSQQSAEAEKLIVKANEALKTYLASDKKPNGKAERDLKNALIVAQKALDKADASFTGLHSSRGVSNESRQSVIHAAGRMGELKANLEKDATAKQRICDDPKVKEIVFRPETLPLPKSPGV